jgi:ATP synthase A1 C subunit
LIDDYGYLNARVRGMSTRLLGGEVYPALLEARGLDAFAVRLAEAPNYRRLLDQERSEGGGELDVHAVDAALLLAYAEDVRKVQHISAGAPRELVDLFLARYDLHNVRTLARGLLRGHAKAEVLQGTIPLGAFTAAELEELASSEDLRSLASTLVTWDVPFGAVLSGSLRELRGLEGDILLALDLALDAAWFPWAVEKARNTEGGADLADSLAAEVDLRNLVTLLKLARQGTGPAGIMERMIPGGLMGERQLRSITEAGDLRGSMDLIARTRYGDAVSGAEEAGRVRISSVERGVERMLVNKFSRLFRKDPLGFPTMLGYLWRRHAEYTDLRLIARGQAYGLPGGEVRSQMVHA